MGPIERQIVYTRDILLSKDDYKLAFEECQAKQRRLVEWYPEEK